MSNSLPPEPNQTPKCSNCGSTNCSEVGPQQMIKTAGWIYECNVCGSSFYIATVRK